eukprot:NODE_42_length_29671_cov_0.584810.p6 type:complete len:301 gc:universal NODE_42_length_29671_cov_0.584810:19552-20454(+)
MDPKSNSKVDIDSVDDGPIKNLLVSILDTMKSMDNKMNMMLSNLSTIDRKVTDHSQSFGRIEKQLGIVSESTVRHSVGKKYGVSFAKSFTFHSLGDVFQHITNQLNKDPQRAHFTSKTDHEVKALEKLISELKSYSTNSSNSESNRNDATAILKEIEESKELNGIDPEFSAASLLGCLLLIDFKEFKKYKKKGLKGLGIELDYKGLIKIIAKSIAIKCGESKLKNIGVDGLAVEFLHGNNIEDAQDQLKLRINLIKKCIVLSDVYCGKTFLEKGYIFTTGTPGYKKNFDSSIEIELVNVN